MHALLDSRQTTILRLQVNIHYYKHVCSYVIVLFLLLSSGRRLVGGYGSSSGNSNSNSSSRISTSPSTIIKVIKIR